MKRYIKYDGAESLIRLAREDAGKGTEVVLKEICYNVKLQPWQSYCFHK